MGESGQTGDGESGGKQTDSAGRGPAKKRPVKKRSVKKAGAKKRAVKKISAPKPAAAGRSAGENRSTKKRSVRNKVYKKRAGRRAGAKQDGRGNSDSKTAASGDLEQEAAFAVAGPRHGPESASTRIPPPIENVLSRLKNEIEAVDAAPTGGSSPLQPPEAQASAIGVPPDLRASATQGGDEAVSVRVKGESDESAQPLRKARPLIPALPGGRPALRAWLVGLLLVVAAILFLYFI